MANEKFTAAAVSDLASKILVSRTVAGVAGNAVLPAAGKVLSGTTYGAWGNAVSGTLTLPLEANTLVGSPAYGDPGDFKTPSYGSIFPPLIVRPMSPVITSLAFNFSPDRISLTWAPVADAAGYLVIMHRGTSVTWTPTDGVSYHAGLYGSDSVIYSGTGTTVTYTTAVTASTNFYFALYSYQSNKIYSALPTTKIMLSCQGLAGGSWVAVPGDTGYGTSGFCVQKYVPSDVGGMPTSQAGVTPLVNTSQVTARASCSGLGSGYHLMTNPEWMTIAANVANTASNWSGGVVGAGALPKGHTDNSPASACAADGSDANAWVETNCTGQTQGALLLDQRRTKYLSNGEVIWDIGGNVGQWVDYTNASDKPTPATAAWSEFVDITGSTTTPKSHLVPLASAQSWWTNTWDSSQGIGQIYPGTNDGTSGAMQRGGRWDDGSNSGLFTAHLALRSRYGYAGVAFRCTWAP